MFGYHRDLFAMWSTRILKLVGIFILSALGLELMAVLLRYNRKKRTKLQEVLFFPSRVTCVYPSLYVESGKCGCKRSHADSSIMRLIRHLLSTRQSLDLCLFSFTDTELSSTVVLLHQRGVRVRVIADSNYMALNGSKIGILRKAGIPVRHDQSRAYMHHKFAVIDKTVLLTGSLNWTSQALLENRENLLITNDEALVKPFLDQFEELWEEYDPTKYNF
ncbi:mitochondrial cardiolipin hydrolase [Protopterus annectens]|nr:mitochondrial cardiolipin hydrolase [Protopterus annectens]